MFVPRVAVDVNGKYVSSILESIFDQKYEEKTVITNGCNKDAQHQLLTQSHV